MRGRFLRGMVASILSQSGATALEMAVVLPLVLSFLFGLTEFGRAIWTKATLDFAVESAARCFAVDTTNCGTAAATQTYAATRAAGLGLTGTAFTVTLPTPTCGKQVIGSLTFKFAAAGLFAFPILTLNSTACYPT